MLNRYDRSSPMNGEAEVKYLDGDFRVVRPGAFVRCAVTGVPIPLEELKYWDVDLQEAYATPEAVLQRHRESQKRPQNHDHDFGDAAAHGVVQEAAQVVGRPSAFSDGRDHRRKSVVGQNEIGRLLCHF